MFEQGQLLQALMYCTTVDGGGMLCLNRDSYFKH